MNNKNIKVVLNSNLVNIFSGRYETFWEFPIDDEQEQDEIEQGLDLSMDNYLTMDDILAKYQGAIGSSDFGLDFIVDINFTGFYSPKYYNYSTDTIDFILDIDEPKMFDALDNLKDNKEFELFLYENFTSRDGFWSHTPNKYDDLVYQIKTGGDEYEQSVGALISFLVGNENLGNIEYQAYYN